MSLKSTLFAMAAALAIVTLPAQAATYTDRTTFLGQLGASVTDDYEAAGYQTGDSSNGATTDIHSDAHMSGILGETDYTTTGYTDWNLVGYVYTGSSSRMYCAGCNGSFILSFGTTSVGSASGVFGVGFDFFNADSNRPYNAFVTYGDGSTENILMPFVNSSVGTQFFGLTSTSLILSIAFGLPNGGTTIYGAFGLDNLTIGSQVPAVPVPAALPLLAGGFGLLGLVGWRRKRKAAHA